MSEYIVDYPQFEHLSIHEFVISFKEEIVRCRDCVECEHWEATKRKPERYICLSHYCIEVNPNDFCAWGERNVNS